MPQPADQPNREQHYRQQHTIRVMAGMAVSLLLMVAVVKLWPVPGYDAPATSRVPSIPIQKNPPAIREGSSAETGTLGGRHRDKVDPEGAHLFRGLPGWRVREKSRGPSGGLKVRRAPGFLKPYLLFNRAFNRNSVTD